MERYKTLALDILKALNLEGTVDDGYCVSNCIKTNPAEVCGTKITIEVVNFGKTCRIDIDFSLPEGSVEARTFMDHCADIEHTEKNNCGEYCYGPKYPSWQEENRNKQTFAYNSYDWHDFFYVRSEHYPPSCLKEAADNAVGLARQFIDHLGDLASMRYWKPGDKEVAEKAKQIVSNASFVETDIDREEKSHYLRDTNSFIHGWFMPFNDRGRGTFDTVWPSSLDYAARTMGHPGTFEYAVACAVLENQEYIAKARKACHIRTETCQY